MRLDFLDSDISLGRKQNKLPEILNKLTMFYATFLYFYFEGGIWK